VFVFFLLPQSVERDQRHNEKDRSQSGCESEILANGSHGVSPWIQSLWRKPIASDRIHRRLASLLTLSPAFVELQCAGHAMLLNREGL
jgi:hypothetical protein